jgi:hypothetical protein
MKHGSVMAGSYSLTHLCKHWGDKAETRVGEQLRRVERWEEARCRRSMGQRRICGEIDIVMIAGLFKKVEQILARDVFEKEKNEGWGFQCAMQRDNVVMHRNGLVNGRLRKLCVEFFLIQIGFGKKLDGIFTTILCWGTHRWGVVKLEATTGVDMIILGGWRAGKHLAYEVDDGIAARAKLTDDLEFGSKFSVVGRLVRDETK